jgi:ATP-dependent RNA helicase DDX1
MTQFEALGLLPQLVEATAQMNWMLPRDVQDESIPLILGGADVMIAAETGSGKTGAFCLPTLQLIYEYLRGQAIVTKLANYSQQSGTTTNSFPESKELTFIMNPLDRDTLCAVSNDGLTVQTRHPKDWAGIRSNIGVNIGRFAFEAKITDEGLCRIGWATLSAARNIGTDNYSFGYGGTGKKSHANQFLDYGEPFKLNDVITCYIDLHNLSISFGKNGKFLGKAFDIPTSLRTSYFYPAVSMKNAEIRFNFMQPQHSLQPEFSILAQAEAKQTSLTAPKDPSGPNSSAKQDKFKPWKPQDGPLAVIIEPTRELALQVDAELTKFKHFLTDPPIIHKCFVTGSDNKQMYSEISRGLHILVATPGKLIDLVKNDKISLSSTRLFILDEADQLINIGIQSDLLNLYSKMPREDKQMQVIICSATLHSAEITQLAQEITVNAQWVDLKGRDSVPATVDHLVVLVDPLVDRSWQAGSSVAAQFHTDAVHRNINLRAESAESYSEAIKLLKPQILIQIIEQFQPEQCMIFCRTQLDCDNLEKFLIELGGGSKFHGKMEKGKENLYSCVALHGGRRPEEREANLTAFREGDVRFLISTDVAARGIDIKNLPFVINCTLPDRPETYIHRIGRVGRAEATGLAISIVATQPEKQWFHSCGNRGKGCHNTNLTTQGGCCIWFNEQEMLAQIEGKLGNITVPHFDRHALYKGAQYLIEQAALGRGKPDDIYSVAAQHVELLQPSVQALLKLETEAQFNYLEIKHMDRWKNMLNSK